MPWWSVLLTPVRLIGTLVASNKNAFLTGLTAGLLLARNAISVRRNRFLFVKNSIALETQNIAQAILLMGKKQETPHEFIGDLTHELWPELNNAVSDSIKTSVGGILSGFSIKGVSDLSFTHVDLGRVPPKITKIEVSKIGSHDPTSVFGRMGNTAISITFQWEPLAPNIELECVVMKHISLKAKVINLKVAGTFLIDLCPLVDKFPLFGAMVMGFPSRPKLDFQIEFEGTNMSGIESLHEELMQAIVKGVSGALVWPNTITVPILDRDTVDYSYLRTKPSATLKVRIIQAKNLPSMDKFGRNDVYCRLDVNPKEEAETEVVKGSDPVFNQDFIMAVHDKNTQSLFIQVLDEDNNGFGDLIGSTSYFLNKLELNKEENLELEIKKNNETRGSLLVRLILLKIGHL